ncbi:MAG: twin-arginine translocase TatA/TatE family subunit [Legionellaceae bacterium]|nr:twin-arginine translocase TatA/TatE family subunit [Legionellaceae bacterium]
MSKLMVVMVVFLLVFSPKKLPELISKIGRLFAKYEFYKHKIMSSSHKIIQDEVELQKLQENLKKAQVADVFYAKKD